MFQLIIALVIVMVAINYPPVQIFIYENIIGKFNQVVPIRDQKVRQMTNSALYGFTLSFVASALFFIFGLGFQFGMFIVYGAIFAVMDYMRQARMF